MMRFAKNLGEQNFDQAYMSSIDGAGATRAALFKLLKSMDLVGWSRREDSGRIDRRAFARLSTGDTSVFSRRTMKEAENAAVSIMVDCSCSMQEGNSETAIEAAEGVTIQLAKMLDQAKVRFSVTGFFGYTLGFEQGLEEEVTFIPIKTWNEPIRKARPKLGNIRNMVDGATPDYSSLYLGIEELSTVPEKRKILFVITDADRFTPDHIHHLHKIADCVGVTIIAIGIKSDKVAACFRNSVSVESLNDLGSSAFKVMLNTIKGIK